MPQDHSANTGAKWLKDYTPEENAKNWAAFKVEMDELVETGAVPDHATAAALILGLDAPKQPKETNQ